MAGKLELTKPQLEAIARLADGMTQAETQSALNVSRTTLYRWTKIPEFANELEAEIERRKSRAIAQYQQAADEVQDKEIESLKEDLRRYREALIDAQRTRIGRGLRLLNKVGKRFDDLPEEAIGIKEIAALLLAGDRLVSQGLESWGDAIAVADLLQQLKDGKI